MSTLLSSSKINLHPWIKALFGLLFGLAIGLLTYRFGFMVLGATIAALGVMGYIVLLFYRPTVGLFSALSLAFCIPLIGRYVTNALPLGFVVECLLVLTYMVIFFKYYDREASIYKIPSKDVIFMVGLWMFYILLEILNPLAPSVEAWFYAMRGIALMPFMSIPLGMMLLKSKVQWRQFLAIYFSLGLFAIFWGIKQDLFGVSAAEQRWLAAGAAETHILFGQLRIFSFYTDAGTFGAGMGQLCIFTGVLFLGPHQRKSKLLYLVVGILAFYAMILTGTRGALVVPVVGAVLYIIMIRRFKYIMFALLVLAMGFSFLKYTSIGQSNYEVQRMRTALNPENVSLQVRLHNRERLTEYLKDKPFGGGVGSVGAWGRRFSPGTWLAAFPPDGLYTRLRGETGRIGQLLFLAVWLYILIKGIGIAWRLKAHPKRQNYVMAILAGLAGMLAGNYSNEVMLQYPNNLITFFSVAFLFTIPHWAGEDEKRTKTRH